MNKRVVKESVMSDDPLTEISKEFVLLRAAIESAKIWMVVTWLGTILSVWGAALALARFLRP